ncbi:hypothetical protein I312_106369 [Cryptococcus bacillisporus CA1280]|uniref:uncharacterized protein n=1 Tax=Cryptococcus bacillisporus CA1280 TaxID=1296109 RepID=UPI0033690E30
MHLFRIFIVFNGINASQPESDSVNSELNRWLGSDDDGVRYMGPREYWESHHRQISRRRERLTVSYLGHGLFDHSSLNCLPLGS